MAERTAELNQKAQKLFETNTALKVLLEKREEDKRFLEARVMENSDKLIRPYLEKLKLSENNASEITIPAEKK